MKKILTFLFLFTGLAATLNAGSVDRANNQLGRRICLQHVYEWQDDASGMMTVSEGDPYYIGGWTSTVVAGETSGTVMVEGGITPYGLSQPLKVSGNQVTLQVSDEPFATVSSSQTNTVGGVTTKIDSVSLYYVVNEDWLVNGGAFADVKGTLLYDGSIHIAGGFAYYIETTVTTTITGKNGVSSSDTDETVSTSPIYRDTWLMVANGKHEFVDVSGGTTNVVDVNIRQSGDTVWVTNLYGYGAPEVYMLLSEDGTMNYPSQMLRDIPAEMSPNGSGMWVNRSGNTGTVTTEAITWGVTTPTDGTQNWSGWRDNRLYYTDGSKFVIPGTEPQGMRGDVNNDGAVTISDVTTLINALLNGNVQASSEFNPTNADTNLDHNLTIGDVTILINFLLSGNWAE